MSSNLENVSNPPQTILVVDNLEEARGLLAGWLARRGYRVTPAEDGAAAVEAARRILPDLILMDLKMPGMDGVAAAQSIHGDLGLRDVPIVAVTADNTAYYREKTREAGFSDYLVKPFEPAELEGVLERLLPTRGAPIH